MTCAKCNVNEAAGKHRWCRDCQAEYHRERKRTERERLHKRDAEEIRRRIVEIFEAIGTGQLTGLVAASIVKDAKL